MIVFGIWLAAFFVSFVFWSFRDGCARLENVVVSAVGVSLGIALAAAIGVLP